MTITHEAKEALMLNHPYLLALGGAIALTLLILSVTSLTYHVTGLLDHYVWQPGLKATARTMDRVCKRICRLSTSLAWKRSARFRYPASRALDMVSDALDYMRYRPLAHANGCWTYAEQDEFLDRFGDVPPHPSVADPDNPWLFAEECPLFEHDCDGCEYLGQYEGRDLYYCPGEPTVISRNSSDGGDYSSGICFAEGPHAMPRLAEALRRARVRGLA